MYLASGAMLGWGQEQSMVPGKQCRDCGELGLPHTSSNQQWDGSTSHSSNICRDKRPHPFCVLQLCVPLWKQQSCLWPLWPQEQAYEKERSDPEELQGSTSVEQFTPRMNPQILQGAGPVRPEPTFLCFSPSIFKCLVMKHNYENVFSTPSSETWKIGC